MEQKKTNNQEKQPPAQQGVSPQQQNQDNQRKQPGLDPDERDLETGAQEDASKKYRDQSGYQRPVTNPIEKGKHI